jgi:hypothetical protein
MNHPLFVTGNIFCSECGAHLIPELRRRRDDSWDGHVTVSGHKPGCSLYGKLAVAKLPEVEAVEIKVQAAQG